MASLENARAIFATLKQVGTNPSKLQELIDLLNKETELDIDDNTLSSTDIDNLMKALERNSSIQHIIFSCIHINIAMAHAIERFLIKNRGVNCLTLYYTTFDGGVEQILTAALEVAPTLKELALSTIDLKDLSRLEIFTNAIARNKYLQALTLRHCPINSAGASALAKMLEDNSTLTSLDISYTPILNEGATILAKTLKQNTTLKHLKLMGSINYPGSHHENYHHTLSDGRMALQTVHLDSDTNTTYDGVDAILSAIEQHPSLTSLDLSLNQMTPNGIKTLDRILKKTSNLNTLVLDETVIGTAGMQMLASALKENTSLTTLSLDSNYLQFEDTKALLGALEQNTTLNKLNLKGNVIGEKGAELLMKIISKKNTLIDVSLSTYSSTRYPKENLSKNTVNKIEGMISRRKKAWQIAQRRMIENNLKILPPVLSNMVVNYTIEEAPVTATEDPAVETLVQKFMSSQNEIPKEEKGFLASIKFYLRKIRDWFVKQVNKISNFIRSKKSIEMATASDNIAQNKTIPSATVGTGIEPVKKIASELPSAVSSEPEKTGAHQPKITKK